MLKAGHSHHPFETFPYLRACFAQQSFPAQIFFLTRIAAALCWFCFRISCRTVPRPVSHLPVPPSAQGNLPGNRFDFLLNRSILAVPIASLCSQHLETDQLTGQAGIFLGTEGGLTELGFPVSSWACFLKIDIVFTLHYSCGNAKRSQR